MVGHGSDTGTAGICTHPLAGPSARRARERVLAAERPPQVRCAGLLASMRPKTLRATSRVQRSASRRHLTSKPRQGCVRKMLAKACTMG